MATGDATRRDEATGTAAVGLPLLAAGLTGLTGLAAGTLLAGAGYVLRQMTATSPPADGPRFGFTPWELGADFEEVCFPTVGGDLLSGWLLTRPYSSRAVVGLGGYRGQRADLLGIGTALWRAGYSVLLFDYRGHGESEGRRVTLGYDERHDFAAALAWLRARLPDVWVGTIGFSMGGAVAILGAADEPAVRAVVTDCAFCRQEEVVRRAWVQRTRLPARPVVDLAGRLLPRLHGFGFGDVEPLASVARISPRPLLLIHAARDAVVPAGDAYRLYEAANPPREVWMVPDQPHCGAYFADRIAYARRVIDFFERAALADGMPPLAPLAG